MSKEAKGKKRKKEKGEAARWPTERAVFFRPERLKYVRKQIKHEGCVFCEALKKGLNVESLLIYEGDLMMVILNKYPYNNGHLLVVPKRHTGDYTDLTNAELHEMGEVTQLALKALKKAYEPAGFNCGLNLGAGSGAGIPEHIHFHVLPRWLGDANFFPLIAQTKVVIETLEQTYERLLPYFKAKKRK